MEGIIRNRNNIIIGSAVLLTGAVVYIVINKKQKNNLEAAIRTKINEGKQEAGTYQDLEKANAFDPDYWTKVKNSGRKDVLILTQDAVKKYGDRIYGAKGILNDDEDAVYTAIDRRNKVQISQIANYFRNNKGARLYDYLTSFLSPSEMEKVKNIINSKPDY